MIFTGVDGIQGQEPPDSTNLGYLDTLGFTKEESHYSPGGPTTVYEYKYFGKPARPATKGGHGGCGGQGGSPGVSHVFGMNDENSIIVDKQKGTLNLISIAFFLKI